MKPRRMWTFTVPRCCRFFTSSSTLFTLNFRVKIKLRIFSIQKILIFREIFSQHFSFVHYARSFDVFDMQKFRIKLNFIYDMILLIYAVLQPDEEGWRGGGVMGWKNYSVEREKSLRAAWRRDFGFLFTFSRTNFLTLRGQQRIFPRKMRERARALITQTRRFSRARCGWSKIVTMKNDYQRNATHESERDPTREAI